MQIVFLEKMFAFWTLQIGGGAADKWKSEI